MAAQYRDSDGYACNADYRVSSFAGNAKKIVRSQGDWRIRLGCDRMVHAVDDTAGEAIAQSLMEELGSRGCVVNVKEDR